MATPLLQVSLPSVIQAVITLDEMDIVTEMQKEGTQYRIRIDQLTEKEKFHQLPVGQLVNLEIHHHGGSYQMDGCAMGIASQPGNDHGEEYLILDYCTPPVPYDFRQFERIIPVPMPTVVGESSLNTKLLGTVLDVSEGGIGVRTHSDVNRDERVRGELMADPPIPFLGRVVYLLHEGRETKGHTRDWYLRIGIEFLEVDRDALQPLILQSRAMRNGEEGFSIS